MICPAWEDVITIESDRAVGADYITAVDLDNPGLLWCCVPIDDSARIFEQVKDVNTHYPDHDIRIGYINADPAWAY